MLHTLLRSAFVAALAVAVLHTPAADARKPAAGAAAPAALDSIVAVVEEDVVLRTELDAEVNRMSHQLRAQGAQVPPARSSSARCSSG